MDRWWEGGAPARERQSALCTRAAGNGSAIIHNTASGVHNNITRLRTRARRRRRTRGFGRETQFILAFTNTDPKQQREYGGGGRTDGRRPATPNWPRAHYAAGKHARARNTSSSCRFTHTHPDPVCTGWVQTCDCRTRLPVVSFFVFVRCFIISARFGEGTGYPFIYWNVRRSPPVGLISRSVRANRDGNRFTPDRVPLQCYHLDLSTA